MDRSGWLDERIDARVDIREGVLRCPILMMTIVTSEVSEVELCG